MANNRKNFIWNAIGLTLNSFNSLFFLIVVRYINGLDVAGIFTYAFALCTLFYVIAIYYNRSFQISNHNFSFSDFFTCRIITSVASLILIFIFALINQSSPYEIAIIMLLMLFRVVEAISDCFYGAIHKKSHLYKTGISLSFKAILGLAAFALADHLTGNLPIAIASLVLINLLVFLLYDLKNYRTLYSEKLTLNLKKLIPILKTCFPVFLFSALAIYLTNCQKYILPYFESNEAQTIFGILIMPATIVGLVGSYLVNPFLDRLTHHYESRNFKKYAEVSYKILLVLSIVGVLATIACFILGIPILQFIYHLDLAAYRIPLLLVIIGATFSALAMVISNLLTVLQENRRQTYIYIIAAALSTVISILLIQSLGIVGAIYAFLASSFILFILYLFLFRQTLKHRKENHAS